MLCQHYTCIFWVIPGHGNLTELSKTKHVFYMHSRGHSDVSEWSFVTTIAKLRLKLSGRSRKYQKISSYYRPCCWIQTSLPTNINLFTQSSSYLITIYIRVSSLVGVGGWNNNLFHRVRLKMYPDRAKAKILFDVCRSFLWSFPILLWSFSLSLGLGTP